MENIKKGNQISEAEAFAIVCKQLEGKELTREELEIIRYSINDLKLHFKELSETIPETTEDLNKSMKESLSNLVNKFREKLPKKKNIVKTLKKVKKIRIIVKEDN